MMQAYPSGTAYALPAREAGRRSAVNLVLVLYLLSLVEGPLRKWLLPEASTPLYFLRDPVVIYLYFHALRHRLFPFTALAQVWLFAALLASVWGLIPFLIYGYNVLGWPLGVRTYFLYMPLAFVVAGTFRFEDVRRFLRLNLWLALPYAALVIFQYSSPSVAWINRGLDADADVVKVTGDIVRPYGLFTFTGPNVAFTAATVASFVGALTLAPRDRLGMPPLILAALAVGSMAVLTGSRSIYFYTAAVLMVTSFGAVAARPSPRTLKTLIALALCLVMAAVIYTTAFGDMYAAMEARFERAARSEGSIWNRAFSGPLRAIAATASAPFLGYGIGVGTPAITNFLEIPALSFGEADLERNINELGTVVGTFFALLRLITAALLVLIAARAARRGILVALPLAGFAMLPIAMGQITHSTINAFLPWTMAGMVLALAAEARRRRAHHSGGP